MDRKGIREINKKKNEVTLRLIYPEFETEENGITICKKHTLRFKQLLDGKTRLDLSTTRINPLTMNLLYPSCKKCDYYINNECYFSQEEIKKFRRGLGLYIFFNRYRCELCATPIKNIHNLMQQQFLEKNNNIKIPLLCSECKYSIKKT